MKRDIVFLGTGYALALNCYNSCFVIRNDNEYFMVDAGGGNQILKLLQDTKIDIDKIHDLFVTHYAYRSCSWSYLGNALNPAKNKSR